jgi:predicted Rossmann fold nucleotide-binding protein DprA/Smf involved in DNA uptake
MNSNSNAIFTLCSHLCVGDNVIPLEPKEWGDLAKKLMDAGLQPESIFELSRAEFKDKLLLSEEYTDRIFRLIDRNASLSFELSQLQNMGVFAITRADKEYPSKLKKVLGNNCPPIFYVAGDLSLLDYKYIGYVGSRTVSEDDIIFTKETVFKTVNSGFGVVSGGAKGIDTVSEESALEMGAPIIEYLSDSMLKKMKKSSVVRAIANKKMLLLSVVKPDAGFNVGIAMMRNRYIYAQSSGTVVVRSEYNKGGTWAGAVENLKYGWCKELCWDKKTYQGNKALIQQGAIPVGSDWDGNIEALESSIAKLGGEQLTLFD